MSEFRSIKQVIAHLDSETAAPWFDEAATKELIEFCLSTLLMPCLDEYEAALRRPEVEQSERLHGESFKRAQERIELAHEANGVIDGLVPVLAEAIEAQSNFAARGMLAGIQQANNAMMRLLRAGNDPETDDEVAELIRRGRNALLLPAEQEG